MRLISCLLVAGASSVLGSGAVQAQAPAAKPDPQALATLALSKNKGIAVVGILRDGKSSFATARSAGLPIASEPMLFEIGSISKVFTGLLLAQAVEKGEMRLEDNLAGIVGEREKLAPQVGAITLGQLITHTSCLTRLPSDFYKKKTYDEANPYVDYDKARIWHALTLVEKPLKAPCNGDYSNWGVALVGQALAERYGKSWEQLVRERITEPLGMKDTLQVLGPRASQLVPGFNGDAPAGPWDMQAFAGAGALRSSAADMLTFGAALMAGKAGPLGAPAERALLPLAAYEGHKIGYAVMIGGEGASRVYTHAGGTGGYRTFLHIAPERREVVIVLASNANTPMPMVQAALRDAPAIKTAEVPLDAALLPSYAGVYRVDNKLAFTFVPQDGKLYGRITGQGFNPLTPTGPDTFAFPQVGAEFKFGRSANLVTSATLSQHGAVRLAQRSDTPAPTLALLPAAQIEPFAGQYEAPGMAFDVKVVNGHLLAKLNTQPAFPVWPVAGRADRFAYDVVDAQLQFERDASGKVIALVLHQNGEQRVPRRVAQ